VSRKWLLVVSVAVVGLVGGVAWAAGTGGGTGVPGIPGTNGAIQGCYRTSEEHRLRLVVQATDCKKNDEPLRVSCRLFGLSLGLLA